MKEALRSMTEDMMAMIRRKDFAPFNLALSGGETAKHMFSLWVDEYKDKIDWNNIRFFYRGDALFMGRKGILAVVQSNAYVRLHHPRRR